MEDSLKVKIVNGKPFLPMEDREISRTANAIKAMAHPLRMKLLCVLGDREMSVHELSNRVQRTSQSNISQHLAHLLDSGILANRKYGNQVIYRIRDKQILGVIDLVKCLFCQPPPS
jgi:DNA-binding transcriptional ArsR family regulator